jgi:hypothetical protein
VAPLWTLSAAGNLHRVGFETFGWRVASLLGSESTDPVSAGRARDCTTLVLIYRQREHSNETACPLVCSCAESIRLRLKEPLLAYVCGCCEGAGSPFPRERWSLPLSVR